MLFTLTDFNLWSVTAISLWTLYLTDFLSKLNHSIAFREYILMMYGLNYLFSAAIQYEITQEIAYYKMKLSPETYFSLAIPALLCFHAGLYSFKTKLFTYNFDINPIQTVINEKLLKTWLIAGIILSLSSSFFPGDLAFIVYLLSGIKYIGAFGLFIIDRQKYKWYLYGILLIELVNALRLGMFHDLVIWCLFFGMVWTFLNKPKPSTKFVLILIAIIVLFTLQSVKSAYRTQLQSGESGLGSLTSVVSEQSEGKGGIFNLDNLALSLTRSNQGWIYASSVDHTNKTKDFQKMKLLNIYFEAAVLPRFLAPQKLEAGDKTIFNKFSGARIARNSSTSMGLGLFADGYISYGTYGTFIFAFLFGVICSLIFKIIEKWSAISPFFVLFSFVLLNYAVRADCETQTWMGHIVKGLIVFSILMYFTKQYFRRKTLELNEMDAEMEASNQPLQLIPKTT